MSLLNQVMGKTIAQQLNITKFPLEITAHTGDLGVVRYYENETGFWIKREYNHLGHIIYFEDSAGRTYNNRPKSEETFKDFAEKLGLDYEFFYKNTQQ